VPLQRKIRLLGSSGEGHIAGLAAHVRHLQDQGPVLFVTADRPYGSWTSSWSQAGVDPERLCIIDAVSATNGHQPATRPSNVVFLPSPTMLEMLVLRIEQSAHRSGAKHVVLDSLNTLALYNGVAPVQAFAHYLVNRLRAADLGGDLVVRDSQSGVQLRERVAAFVDEDLALGATR
jgi:KaiC/GvpD/RAD55 family RecA-like ATPase